MSAPGPGDRQAVLSWSAPENEGGSAVTDYEVRHAEGATVPANTAWTSVGFVTTHTVTGLDNGELHSFEVRAVSTRGGGRAARIQATPATKPSAPQELTARASAGRVDLAWSAPADDGGFDILRYEIRHAKGASVPNDTAWTELELYRTYYFAGAGLDNGEQYSFEVRAVSVQGPGPAALIQATPGGPPTAPEGLSATPGDRQAVLSWSAPENEGGSAVTDYEVRHAEGATVPANTAWTSVGFVTTHTVTGLDNGELHSFEVRAVSTRGGGRAARIQATPATKPSAPQELTARASAGRVDLAWSAPADDGGFDILRYEIRHAKGASVPNDTAWTELELYRTYYFAGAGLDNGEQYSFEVRAVSVQGPGPAALIQATPGGPPTTPEGLSAAPGDRQAVLSWSAPENDGGSAVTDYEVRHAEGATVPANTAWTSVGLVTTHTVTGLDNGELHSFEVRAVSTRGGGRAARIQATPATKPSAPQELTARASAGRVDLAWSAPADDGGFDILRYEIRHAKGASVPNDTAWTELELHRTYFFASIDNGEQYSFEVRAVSVQGPGPAALIQATPGEPPTAPEGLSAAPGDRQAVLSWSAPENDNGSAVTDYEVRHAEGATVPANTAWTSVGFVTTHTVTGLDNGELHSFEVRAVSGVGPSATVAAMATPGTTVTVAIEPDAPRDFTAVPGDGRVTLRWRAPANDGGSAVSHYQYRYAAGNSVPSGTSWESVQNAHTVMVEGLDNGTQYAFEVRAVNGVGPSATAAATATPATPAIEPDAPRDFKAVPGDGRVTLRRRAPATDGGSAVSHYQYRYAAGNSVPSGTPWKSVQNALTVTVDGLDNGTQYVFELRAVNGVGPGATAAATATPAIEPDAPRDFTAVPGDRRVTLRWRAPATDGGSAVSHYQYRYAAGNSVPSGTPWKSVQNALTVTVDGLDNGTQYVFELRAVNAVGPSAAVTATATLSEGPAVAELQRHIAGFMLNRANALANSQPRLTRFLKDGRPANSLAGQGTEHAGAIRGSLQVQGFWLDVNGAMSNAADARSRYLFGSVGGHWRVNERLLAGVMLQLDTADETLPGQAGDIAGKGSMVGPYFAAKLEGQPLYLEGRLLYGQTENRLAHSRGVTGEFGTARWLAQLRMEGNVALDAGLALTPFADLTGARDRQRGFTDSLERQVGGQTVSLGQAKFGVDFRLPLHVEQGNLALTGGAAGVFSSTDSGAAGAGVEAARARLGLGLGLDYRLDDTYSFEVKGNYDGIGARDYQSFGLRGDLKIRF